MQSSQEDVLDALERLRAEVHEAADYAHKAMWWAALAAIAGLVLVLKAGGFL